MTSGSDVALKFESRVNEITRSRHQEIILKTDRLFSFLLFFQWIVGIFFAFFLSPKTWSGEMSQTHIHVYAAIFLGGAIAGLPIFLTLRYPGATINRMVISAAQIFFSILFIHLTGGRIETHFHIFGSLAFLAFYRDPRTLIIATIITAIDHFLRGALWPQSVYGTLSSTPWRALEHAAWVAFEDVILFSSINIAFAELRAVAHSQAKLEGVIENVENRILIRTKELEDSQKVVLEQHQNMVMSAKMASLGQMSAGIAHEINNPLAIISGKTQLLQKHSNNPEKFAEMIESIAKSCNRISRIVLGLKKFSRTSGEKVRAVHSLSEIVKETLVLIETKSSRHQTPVRFDSTSNAGILCDDVEIEQVIINLVHNSIDAVKERESRWVLIEVYDEGAQLVLRVTDSGPGISEEIRIKLFDPFFTTKPVGEGTGLGLSISKGILEDHGATLSLLTALPNTCFEMRFPAINEAALEQSEAGLGEAT